MQVYVESDRLFTCHESFRDWYLLLVGHGGGLLDTTYAKLGYPTMRLADVDSTLVPVRLCSRPSVAYYTITTNTMDDPTG